MSSTLSPVRDDRPTARRDPPPKVPRLLRRANPLAMLAALGWLVVVGLPLYYLVAVSLRTRDSYLGAGPLRPPLPGTLENYGQVITGEFARYLINTVVVTASSVVLALLLALPAAYGVVRGVSRPLRVGFGLLLLGLAIPAQAVIIPVFLIIGRLQLYDSLTGIVLPTVAFQLPLSILVLTSTLRDIPEELYEAMSIDGAGVVRTMRTLVLPLSVPGLVTVGTYVAVNAWNGFLFPLVLTQSQEQRVLTMGLWSLQGQYTSNVPALMAAMSLSVLPVLAFYVFGRRRLISGLTAGFGK